MLHLLDDVDIYVKFNRWAECLVSLAHAHPKELSFICSSWQARKFVWCRCSVLVPFMSASFRTNFLKYVLKLKKNKYTMQSAIVAATDC